MSATPPPKPDARPHSRARPPRGTVVFVDLAGFTALTDTHGDDEAVAIIDRFEATVQAALVEPSALIKFIGDAAMLVFESPTDAVAAIGKIVDECDTDGFPELRVGLHHGPLTWRENDPLGATVNLASRITAHAAGGQILASAQAASTLTDGTTIPAGEFRARGVTDHIQLVEIASASTATSIDPVCQMQLARGHGAASIVYADQRWDLCSLACARRFTANPDLYLAQLRKPVKQPSAPPTPVSAGE